MLVTILSDVRDRPVLPRLLPLRSYGLLHHVARLREQRPQPAHLHHLQPRLQEGIQTVVAHSLNTCCWQRLFIASIAKLWETRFAAEIVIGTTTRPRLGLVGEEGKRIGVRLSFSRKRHDSNSFEGGKRGGIVKKYEEFIFFAERRRSV